MTNKSTSKRFAGIAIVEDGAISKIDRKKLEGLGYTVLTKKPHRALEIHREPDTLHGREHYI